MNNRDKQPKVNVLNIFMVVSSVALILWVLAIIISIGLMPEKPILQSSKQVVLNKGLLEERVVTGRTTTLEYVCKIDTKTTLFQFRDREKLNAKSLCDAVNENREYIFSYKQNKGINLIRDYYVVED